AISAQKMSDATLQSAQANLHQAELNLSYTLVTAPVSGVAGRIARSEGSLVTAGQDSSLLTTINQVDPIWVRFSLSESDLAKLPDKRLDRIKSAEVRLALPDGSAYPLKGRLNFAATQIDPRLATQELRAEFGNPRVRLLPGEFVRVRLAAGERDNVFLVPQTAVIQTEKTFLVFTLDKENKAESRPVQVGDWVGADWMILGGLNPGDRVILDNLLKVRPGAAVSPQSPAEARPAAAPAAK
ncbi:MAG TPA: efflux RND transporter periplasmic adaptor subunit, partial [Burkholderiales bacterium]|nr:efflux RND transporter periplasmic adaptor subunit [Burkholderiales bacterium]